MRTVRLRTTSRLIVVVLVVLVGSILVLRPAGQSPRTAVAAPLAPPFTLPLLSGGRGALSLRALRGHPVLLNFFQSNCGSCLDEMPQLARAARAYRRQGVVVVGVASLGDAAGAARDLARADRLPFPVAWDAHQAVAWQYQISGTPSTMFIDAQGRWRGQYEGQLDADLIRDGLAQAGAIACSTCAAVEPPGVGVVATTTAPAAALRVTRIFSPPFQAAAPFDLPDQRGHVISPVSQRGKVIALTFISAACIEQCPLVGQTLGQVRRLLGRDASRLSIVAISVAPEQDSAATTLHFAQKAGWLGADWHYLTASRATLRRVWNAYWVPVYAPPPIFKTTGRVWCTRPDCI
jgi:cytochrome oxidase Cu insertion factor (SCO1/SenC/PrrC family)